MDRMNMSSAIHHCQFLKQLMVKISLGIIIVIIVKTKFVRNNTIFNKYIQNVLNHLELTKINALN